MGRRCGSSLTLATHDVAHGAICALRPTYFQLGARARSPALHGVYHYSWNSSTEGVRPCILRALAFQYWDAGSVFSEVLNGWTLLGVDATCRHIPVPQAGLGSEIAWPRIAKEPLQM